MNKELGKSIEFWHSHSSRPGSSTFWLFNIPNVYVRVSTQQSRSKSGIMRAPVLHTATHPCIFSLPVGLRSLKVLQIQFLVAESWSEFLRLGSLSRIALGGMNVFGNGSFDAKYCHFPSIPKIPILLSDIYLSLKLCDVYYRKWMVYEPENHWALAVCVLVA